MESEATSSPNVPKSEGGGSESVRITSGQDSKPLEGRGISSAGATRVIIPKRKNTREVAVESLNGNDFRNFAEIKPVILSYLSVASGSFRPLQASMHKKCPIPSVIDNIMTQFKPASIEDWEPIITLLSYSSYERRRLMPEDVRIISFFILLDRLHRAGHGLPDSREARYPKGLLRCLLIFMVNSIIVGALEPVIQCVGLRLTRGLARRIIGMDDTLNISYVGIDFSLSLIDTCIKVMRDGFFLDIFTRCGLAGIYGIQAVPSGGQLGGSTLVRKRGASRVNVRDVSGVPEGIRVLAALASRLPGREPSTATQQTDLKVEVKVEFSAKRPRVEVVDLRSDEETESDEGPPEDE